LLRAQTPTPISMVFGIGLPSPSRTMLPSGSLRQQSTALQSVQPLASYSQMHCLSSCPSQQSPPRQRSRTFDLLVVAEA